jgi:hypothetical protein
MAKLRSLVSAWRTRQERRRDPAGIVTDRQAREGALLWKASQESSPADKDGSAHSGDGASQDDPGTQRSLRQRLRAKILHWFLYNLTFSMLPLLFAAGSTLGTSQSMSLDLLLAKGELVLISVNIAGSAAGEIVNQQGSNGSIHMSLMWANFLICTLGAWLYSLITATQRTPGMVTSTSLILFGSAIVTGLCSIIRSELR